MNDTRAANAMLPLAVVRDGETLSWSGALVRGAVAGAWSRASTQLAGVRAFDLTGVSVVDSAGIALLAELAARAGGGIVVTGRPPGLDELRAAYRLDESLAFSST